MDDVRNGGADGERDGQRDGQRDIVAAAAVHAAKRELDGAIAELAASPLDQAAAERMRDVLSSSRLRKARRALTRLQRPEPTSTATPGTPAQDTQRPRLSVVDDPAAAPWSAPRAAARFTSPAGAHTIGGIA